jgi:hypothetical protein
MKNKKSEVLSLNLDDLDVEELERRIEMVTITLHPDDPVICYANCGNCGSLKKPQ